MDLVPVPHATYRIPDGDTVPLPAPPPGPPVTRRQLVYGGVIFAALAAGPISVVVRAFWS